MFVFYHVHLITCKIWELGLKRTKTKAALIRTKEELKQRIRKKYLDEGSI